MTPEEWLNLYETWVKDGVKTEDNLIADLNFLKGNGNVMPPGTPNPYNDDILPYTAAMRDLPGVTAGGMYDIFGMGIFTLDATAMIPEYHAYMEWGHTVSKDEISHLKSAMWDGASGSLVSNDDFTNMMAAGTYNPVIAGKDYKCLTRRDHDTHPDKSMLVELRGDHKWAVVGITMFVFVIGVCDSKETMKSSLIPHVYHMLGELADQGF